MKPRGTFSTRLRLGCAIAGLVVILGMGGLCAATNVWPSLGAQGADVLRKVFGNRAVAQLEMIVFSVQDRLRQVKYDLGIEKPAIPWANAPLTPTRRPTPRPAVTLTIPTASPTSQITPTGAGDAPPTSRASSTFTPTPLPTFTPTPTDWLPPQITPLGSLEGEGVWQPYIQDSSGRVVAYRAFIQPDASRPYAVTAAVAFDLTHTRLHYVLGSVEPYSPGAARRPGVIAPADFVSGILLATFNGGFKAEHGQFGAMADGVFALPPKETLGTLAIYADGTVRMGEWGDDITASPEMVALRQNGPLVIHNGAVTPQVYSNSPADWGYTINDVSPTWRSGLGLSADGKTLFYFCGSSLSIPALAEAMLAAGAAHGIQLDINEYWVLFVTTHVEAGQWVVEPLFPKTMKENLYRYLQPYTRDFFYVTVR